VYGTGGVGGYFGGRLAQAGEEVIFIARGAHLQALQTDGLRVESIQGDISLRPVQASDDPRRMGQVDAVLVCVKAWQVPEAAAAMRPLVGEQTLVVPLSNGVDAPGQLAAVLGAGPVLGGLCHISAMIVAPGVIRHAGVKPHVAFGELDGRSGERPERLRQAFERAGVWVDVPADIQSAMWEKFLFIAAFSGVGAVTRLPAGVVRSVPEARQLLEEAMREIEALARKRRVALPAGIISSTLAYVDSLEPGVTASMQRDILAGRPSELQAQNGAVVRMGLELGVPTPVNSFIYASLLPQELRARGEVSFNI
jgi:2-dehydropantoate 2-reductase